MTRPRGPLLSVSVASVVLVAACGEPSPRTAAVTRDSAGVTVVEGPDGASAGPPLALRRTRLGGTRSGVAGGAGTAHLGERPAGAVFSRISDADEGPDGLLYVLDGTEGVVTVLDPSTGDVVRRFGRRGRGPGEFRSAARLRVEPDGHVLVGERIPPVVHRFAPDGSLLGTIRLDQTGAGATPGGPTGGAAALAGWSALPDGGLVARILTLDADPTRSARNRLLRVGPDGAVRSVILRWREPGSFAEPPPLFTARRSWAVSPDGSVHVADGDGYEIHTLDSAGRLRRILRRRIRSRPVTDVERERALEAFRESMLEGGAPAPLVEAVASDLEVASRLPAIQGLWWDREREELWVGIPGMDESRGDLAVAEYHVFGAAGRLRGRVAPPAGFRLHSVRGRRMLGSVEDELGVPHLRIYRVRPVESGGPASP